MVLDKLFPLETWCQIKCIKDHEDCMFDNICGYRWFVIDLIAGKRRNQVKRYNLFHGSDGSRGATLSDLIGLVRVYMMTGFKCWYCGKPMVMVKSSDRRHDTFTFDHKVSLVSGGTNRIENFVCCCVECNKRKGVAENPNNTRSVNEFIREAK